MRVHFPELYDAHRKRSIEFLTRMAETFSLTYEQFEASNWDTTGKVTETMATEIDNDIPVPVDATAPKRRGRKPGTKNAPSQATNLLAAIDFVSHCKSEAYEFSAYVSLYNHVASAYNNIMAAGHPIQEELSRAVHLDKLKAALTKCGRTLTITETEAQLSIKGDKLHALVPCLAEPLAPIVPDDCLYTGDFEILKQAFRIAGTLASETGERPIEASLLLEPNVITGTNGRALMQYWHGIGNIPPGTVIPKAFAAAVAATKLKIGGIGASWNAEQGRATSLTLWFEGGAWMKTQCYEERWPAVDHLLGVPTDPNAILTPPDFFEAINAIEPFISEDLAAVYLVDGAVQTHANGEEGARYDVKGLPAGKIFHPRLAKQVSPYCKTIDLTSEPDKAKFYGGTEANPIRGVIMGITGSK